MIKIYMIKIYVDMNKNFSYSLVCPASAIYSVATQSRKTMLIYKMF